MCNTSLIFFHPYNYYCIFLTCCIFRNGFNRQFEFHFILKSIAFFIVFYIFLIVLFVFLLLNEKKNFIYVVGPPFLRNLNSHLCHTINNKKKLHNILMVASKNNRNIVITFWSHLNNCLIHIYPIKPNKKP